MDNKDKHFYWPGIFLIPITLIVALFMITVVNYVDEQKNARFSYTGTITALEKRELLLDEDYTYIYLDRYEGPLKVEGLIDISIGKTYKITVDGYGEIISIEIP